MKYRDSRSELDTARKILKVNHAGEYGAINIYRSQLLVARVFMKDLVPVLTDFKEDEQRHLQIFWTEIQARQGVRCKSYWLCGLGGYAMEFLSALMGRRGIMACTWAVESVVIEHLHEQVAYLKQKDDQDALQAVEAILEDETRHRDTGFAEGGAGNFWYQPLRFMISLFTEAVIRIGMR